MFINLYNSYKLLNIDYLRLRNNKEIFFPILPSLICKEICLNVGFRAVFLFRIGHFFQKEKFRIGAAFSERIMRHLCHCRISSNVEIGPGFIISHGSGIIIDSKSGPIGNNFTIRQNVTLGGNYGKSNGTQEQPIIGDNVSIGPGAAILGPICIGNNTIIGANAVVTTNIPPNSVVSAFRAEVVATLSETGVFERFPYSSLSRKDIYQQLNILKSSMRNSI